MSDIEITLKLPEALAEDARAMGLLTDAAFLRLLTEEIRRRDEELEAGWEAQLVDKPFAAAFREDGSVDFDALDSGTAVITLPNSD